MLKLPTSLDDVRKLLAAVDWHQLQLEVSQETRARVAIVGPVNTGKSTLFNQLKGRPVSRVSPVPGTTDHLIREDLGAITLIDTPGFGEVGGIDRADIALQAVADAHLVVLLLDAAAGLRQTDIDLYQKLVSYGPPVVTALNKVDLIGKDLPEVVQDARDRLAAAVIPISAKTGWNVSTGLLPEVLARQPGLAVMVGRELPRFRRQAATAVIRQAAALNALAGTEPVPFLDIPVLLATQARMVLRLAAIYGESMTANHARELITTVAGGLALRYLAEEAAKVIPGPGWLASGGIAAAGTWAMGQVAVAYFESGKRLTPPEMRSLYKNLVRRQPERFEEVERET
jgi:small GTP-binding protein